MNLDSDNNKDLYLMSSKFFDECRNKMKKDEYYELIELLKKYNICDNHSDKNLEEIEILFIPYSDLMGDFKKIFTQMKKN